MEEDCLGAVLQPSHPCHGKGNLQVAESILITSNFFFLPYDNLIFCSSLCGNAKQMLSSGMCSSWEDVLWARCKAMVDTLVEEELRRSIARKEK